MSKIVGSVVSAMVILSMVTAGPAIAQQQDEKGFLTWVLCQINSSRDDCSTAVSDDDIRRLLKSAVSAEPGFSRGLGDVRNNFDAVVDKGSPIASRNALSDANDVLTDVEKADTSDFPAPVADVLKTCLDTTKVIQAAASAPDAQKEKTDALSDAGASCTDALSQQEAAVAAQLDANDTERKRNDAEQKEAQTAIDNAKTPEERAAAAERLRRLEEERRELERERAKLERQRMQMQQMRMVLGMMLVALGAALGGPAGMVILSQGLQMLASPPGDTGGTGGRSPKPTSSEVNAEVEQGEADEQAGSSDPAATPPVPSVEARKPDDDTPDPEEVHSFNAPSKGTKVVPVNDEFLANDGYFLTYEIEDGVYTVRHVDGVWKRVIPVDEIVAHQPKNQPVPSPFTITQFVSLNIDAADEIDLSVRLEDVEDDKILVISQNPQGLKGWYLANVLLH